MEWITVVCDCIDLIDSDYTTVVVNRSVVKKQYSTIDLPEDIEI